MTVINRMSAAADRLPDTGAMATEKQAAASAGNAETQGTPESTPKAHKNAHLDTIKAALSGLTRDEILSILADVVSGKIDSGEGARE